MVFLTSQIFRPREIQSSSFTAPFRPREIQSTSSTAQFRPREIQSPSLKAQFRPEETVKCHRFSIEEIRLVTQNFEEALLLGHGGFGKVYRGHINYGSITVVAIKRLHIFSFQGEQEFWTEILMLSRLRHSHIVSLIGYCNDEGEMILVYKYMAKGNLYNLLHRAGGSPLSWVQRLKICIGVASGLDYLHTQHGVVQCDVKSGNILLDENWTAKISDFGLSKLVFKNQASSILANVAGTEGYVDPNYSSTGILTIKSDVYSFGVVLFEVLSGRLAVNDNYSLEEEHRYLVKWAQECIKEGKLEQIIDPSMRRQILPESLKEFVKIANQCLHIQPTERPSMAEVVARLDSALALQERMNNSLQSAGITKFRVSPEKRLTAFSVPSKKSLKRVPLKVKKFFFTAVQKHSGAKKVNPPTSLSPLPTSNSEIITAAMSSSLSSISQELPVTLPPSFLLPSSQLMHSTTELSLTSSTMISSIENTPNSQVGSEVSTEGPIVSSTIISGGPAQDSSVKLALQHLASEMATLSLSKCSTPQLSVPSTSDRTLVPFAMPSEPWKSNKEMIEGVWVHHEYEKLWTKILSLHPGILSNIHVSSDMMKSSAAEEVCLLISTILGRSARELHPSLLDIWNSKLKDLEFLGVDVEPLKKKKKEMSLFIDEIREREDREENARTVEACHETMERARAIFEEAERLFNKCVVDMEIANTKSTALRERLKERCEILGVNSPAAIDFSKDLANEYM